MTESARSEAFASQADRSRALAEGYVRQAIKVARQIIDLRDAITAHIAALHIPHRWVGTRLDLLGPDGNWIIGPDLKGADARGVDAFAIEAGRLVVTYDDGEVADLGPAAGDVLGPSAAVSDSRIALFDGVSGRLLKQAGVAISDLATAAQGAKADSAVQPAGLATALADLSDEIDGNLATKAPKASPALEGVPTAPTASVGTNTNQIATMAAIRQAIDALLSAAPGALDTLNELAAALGNDANFAATVTSALADRARRDQNLADLSSAATAFSNIKQSATTSATGVVEKATDAEVRAATADKFLSADHIETSSALITLSDAATVAIDWDAFVIGDLSVAGNRTIGAPSNVQPGVSRAFFVFGSDATERSIAWASAYKGNLPTETVTATRGMLIVLTPRSASLVAVSYVLLS